MSAFDYAKTAATALRLIKRFGQKLPLAKVESNYDPVTGIQSSVVATNGLVDGVVLLIGRKTVEGLDDKYQQELIEGRVREVLIAASSVPFAPMVGHLINYDGFTWQILSVDPLAPGGTVIIYTCGILKGGAVLAGTGSNSFSADFSTSFSV